MGLKGLGLGKGSDHLAFWLPIWRLGCKNLQHKRELAAQTPVCCLNTIIQPKRRFAAEIPIRSLNANMQPKRQIPVIRTIRSQNANL